LAQYSNTPSLRFEDEDENEAPCERHQVLEDETSGAALALKTGIPSYQVEDEEGRTHLLIHLPIEEEDENRWCLWRPDHAGFDSRSIFEGALVEQQDGIYKNALKSV
jgi:hypothetical protein